MGGPNYSSVSRVTASWPPNAFPPFPSRITACHLFTIHTYSPSPFSLRCWPLSGDKPSVRSSQCSSSRPFQTIWRGASLTRSSISRRWGSILKSTANVKRYLCSLLNESMCVSISQVCANLRDMCVVFAGPFPDGFSERKLKRLFGCCGPVRKIKMLNTAVRVCLLYWDPLIYWNEAAFFSVSFSASLTTDYVLEIIIDKLVL